VRQELELALAERFYAVNGHHEMTAEDDEYVSEWYVPVEDVAREEGMAIDELARLMLGGALPLPSYIRSDGTFMVGRDLLALPTAVGGVDRLPEWFAAQFNDAPSAVSAWVGYVNGHWVCLREVTPEGMKRKDELVAAIKSCLETQDRTDAWRVRLTTLVDELDALEPPFAPYDRLRNGGPVSRDLFVTAVRKEILARTTSDDPKETAIVETR
jgi:hypothetical protein